jgi:hypothetical protein
MTWTWSLPQPVLTVAEDSPVLSARWAAEPKWDGYRAQLAVHAGGRVMLRSRQGTDMTTAFPEIRAAAVEQLPADTGLDGELVVWEQGRLAFERLQQRLARRGRGAAEGAGQWPAHYVVFDLVHADATDLTGWSYARRRAALEALFTDRQLEAPLTLCPSTTDPSVARGWLEWTAVGLEGLCFKRLNEPYTAGAAGGGSTEPAGGWQSRASVCTRAAPAPGSRVRVRTSRAGAGTAGFHRADQSVAAASPAVPSLQVGHGIPHHPAGPRGPASAAHRCIGFRRDRPSRRHRGAHPSNFPHLAAGPVGAGTCARPRGCYSLSGDSEAGPPGGLAWRPRDAHLARTERTDLPGRQHRAYGT